ncbi:MAG: hypothetical protein ACRDOH_33275, partial [Streptosporangiaceae bacterium]
MPRQRYRVAGVADRRRCLAAGQQPDSAAAACRGALRGRFPLVRHAGPDHVLAGASPEAGVVAGPVRLLLIWSCGLVDGASVSRGPGAVRPRDGPSGRWMDGARGMGLPWRCRARPGT